MGEVGICVGDQEENGRQGWEAKEQSTGMETSSLQGAGQCAQEGGKGKSGVGVGKFSLS